MLRYLKKPYQYAMSLFQGYHIIVVPKDRSRTKTLKVSGFSLKVLFVSVILSLPLFLVSVLSTIHYQNKLVQLKRDTYENQKLLKNKEELIAKLALVEKNIALLDDTLGSLGKVMDIDVQNMKTGLGPVSDTELYLPEDEIVSPLESLNLDSEDLVDEWIENNGDISTDKFAKKLADLKGQSNTLNKKIQELFEQSKDKIRFANAIPSVMPAAGWVTSEFGMRSHPISHRFKLHQGLDIASPYGAAIAAPADGMVIYTGYHGGHGQVVLLDHGYGITTLFAHASKIHAKAGDKVERGQLIANVGSTGATTGPHLHYEVRVDGIPTDPMNYIAKK